MGTENTSVLYVPYFSCKMNNLDHPCNYPNAALFPKCLIYSSLLIVQIIVQIID